MALLQRITPEDGHYFSVTTIFSHSAVITGCTLRTKFLLWTDSKKPVTDAILD